MSTTKLSEQKRGQLTDRIKEKSIELLGYEITQTELRLMVYMQYVMVNEQRIERNRVNNEELDIILKWSEMGYVKDYFKLSITKEFWNIICEIIYLGYVDLREASNGTDK